MTLTKGEEKTLKAIRKLYNNDYVAIEDIQRVMKLSNKKRLSGWISSLTKKGYLNSIDPNGIFKDVELNLQFDSLHQI